MSVQSSSMVFLISLVIFWNVIDVPISCAVGELM